MERVLGDSPAALTPDEGRPPLPTETTNGDTRRSDLTKAWPAIGPQRGTYGRWTWEHERRGEATRQQGYQRREQVIEASTATQNEMQAEGPSQREMGTASRIGEEASSTEREVTTGEERATLSQNEACTEGERAPSA